MLNALQQIRQQAADALAQAGDLKALDDLRVKYLGKKGELTVILKQMGKLSAEERPKVGQLANEVRSGIEALVEERTAAVKAALLDQKLALEKLDVTMPGRAAPLGKLHPLTKVLEEVKEIFLGMGFSVAEGPEVETDYYNFEALNIPKDHPARDTQDTFYISDNVLLRTQTSPVQVRTMEKQKPPIRVIAPGRVYRSDAVDATHSPLFHQIEGLVVDRGVTMADLKGTLEMFAKRLYGEEAVELGLIDQIGGLNEAGLQTGQHHNQGNEDHKDKVFADQRLCTFRFFHSSSSLYTLMAEASVMIRSWENSSRLTSPE